MSNHKLTETSRVDAFTDAVLAIILTLMAVELGPPAATQVAELGLWTALLGEWPSFLAFFISFMLVGQVWLSHHAMWQWVARVDRYLLAIHLAHLLFVALIPLASRLLAEYLTGAPAAAKAGAAIYAGVALAEAVFFNLSWLYVRRRGLASPELSPRLARRMSMRYASGILFYALALGIAFVHPGASLAVYFVLIAYFMLPGPGE